MENNNEWEAYELPNLPLCRCKLSDDIVKYLWGSIEDAVDNSKSAKGHLAGNISESLYLNDKDDYFFNTILKDISKKYVAEHAHLATAFRNSGSNFKMEELIMREFWVNSSRETEFNPTHNHGGVLSFVIWMKIPTEWKDQYEIPFIEESNTPMASDFQFLYTDIGGQIQGHRIQMGSHMEGCMCLFPATLIHQVYPFYNCKDDRVTISGNLYFKDITIPDEIHQMIKEYKENDSDKK
tara:strand:- start:63 stop:776 length:714 start_codon:yes stop_codon:yes gene_type:complete